MDSWAPVLILLRMDETTDNQLSFGDVWEGMRPLERAAMVVSGAGFLIAMLAIPSLLSWLTGRPIARDVGTHIFETLPLELLGCVTLFLAPLKVWLKPRLYGDATRAPMPRVPRTLVVIAWISAILGALSLSLPQGFFLLSGRDVASNACAWVTDAGAFLLAVVPSVAALGPWIWASRRLHSRYMASLEAGGDAEVQCADQGEP